MTNKEQVRPKSRAAVHDTILQWFETQKRGTVLDIPAGYGHLSLKLKAMGYQPIAAEIQPHITTPEVETIYSDLNRRIEAEDASFDYVACLEGIEHTLNPYQAIQELARVLKKDGKLVISLPNYTNLERRLRFLLTGSLVLPVSNEKLQEHNNELYEFHNSPLTITLIDLMLRKEGLSIQEIQAESVKKSQAKLGFLIRAAQSALKYLPEKTIKKYRFDLTFHPNVILGGNCVIIIASFM
jgi:SAM-dependent methyltransferase